jgi:NAD(P) transhydrogenase subunit alpha
MGWQAMIVAVPRENHPGERRVALIPAAIPPLVKAGLEILVEAGAGQPAGYSDGQYVEKGAKIAPSRKDTFAADIVLQVRAAGASPEAGQADLEYYRPGQVVIGMCDPLGSPQLAAEVARRGVSLFALELLPRITRAQSMDVLSSQATVAGYRAVLLAAAALPKMFPMMITAAGTLSAAKVFVIGAGVAGLQAIATARRLGAAVSGYDVRPAVKEQVQSLGAKFVEVALETTTAEAKGGYAQQMDEEFYRRQRELMARVVADSDVVITTAAVPDPGDRRDGGPDGPRVGDRRPGGGARRQLRTDQARAVDGRGRRDDPGAVELAGRGPAARQPDVCQEYFHLPAQFGQRQAGPNQPGR